MAAMTRRLPAKGTARRACLDRRVFEKLWAEYSEARNFRGLALLKGIYCDAYPDWPEFAPAPKPQPTP